MGCSSSIQSDDTNVFMLKENHFNFHEEIKDLPNGSKRNQLHWIPSNGNIIGIVIICHGLAEHCLRYSTFASELTKQGFGCFGIDIQGHGLSAEVLILTYYI